MILEFEVDLGFLIFYKVLVHTNLLEFEHYYYYRLKDNIILFYYCYIFNLLPWKLQLLYI